VVDVFIKKNGSVEPRLPEARHLREEEKRKIPGMTMMESDYARHFSTLSKSVHLSCRRQKRYILDMIET
jgi:hypothetical protein